MEYGDTSYVRFDGIRVRQVRGQGNLGGQSRWHSVPLYPGDRVECLPTNWAHRQDVYVNGRFVGVMCNGNFSRL